MGNKVLKMGLERRMWICGWLWKIIIDGKTREMVLGSSIFINQSEFSGRKPISSTPFNNHSIIVSQHEEIINT